MWKNVHPVYGAGILSERESPPITTRPGLPTLSQVGILIDYYRIYLFVPMEVPSIHIWC